MEANAQGAEMEKWINSLESTGWFPLARSSLVPMRHSAAAVPRSRHLHTRASSPRSPHPQAPSQTARLSTTLLTFASPELEAAFQAYLSIKPNTWTLVYLGHNTIGVIFFIYKYLAAARKQRVLLLGTWYLGYLPPVASTVMLGLLHVCPAFYRKHRPALHTAYYAVFIAAFRYGHEMLLWYRQLQGPVAVTLPHRLQSFASENFFGSLVWLMALAFPVGLIPDLALASLFLLVELAANAPICSTMSRFGFEALVTMSPEPLRVVEGVTSWIRGTPAGTLGTVAGAAPPRVVTCPLALAFWQVVAWWAACHLVFAAEISTRRTFLRTTAARNLVGPAHLASALNWPFGRIRKVLGLALVSVGISSCACIIWLAILFHAYI